MKLQTALKLSALAIALGTTASSFAGSITNFRTSPSTTFDNINLSGSNQVNLASTSSINLANSSTINLTNSSKINFGTNTSNRGSIDSEGTITSKAADDSNSTKIKGGSITSTVTGTNDDSGETVINGGRFVSTGTGENSGDTTIIGGSIETQSIKTQGIIINQAPALLSSASAEDEEEPVTIAPLSAFKIKAAPAAIPDDARITPFALDADDILDIDLDGNISTQGNITSDKTISAATMVVGGVDVGNALTNLNTRADQLNSRISDVEKTAYRGVAIALAAQQQVPNIQPGQFAVFGGVGHYEGESAGALGVVGAINERTSLSAAFGIAGSNEVGGRVGVAYVFGGK